MSVIRVIIIDNDPEWQYLIERACKQDPNIQIAGITSSRKSGIRLAQETQADIAIVDVSLTPNETDGVLAALDIYRECGGNTKIIMFTAVESAEVILHSFNAGAVQYIPKKQLNQLVSAINLIHDCHSPLELLLHDYHQLKTQSMLNLLSPSEREVLEHLSQGMTRTQIEEQIYKSRNTIKTQIRNILRKLGVKSTKEALTKIEMRGITDK
ncbi:response regulator transcription factor [Paenibacillus xylaniclasticus]|uniref:response regulator transcription factor n=1 Tax=Paenibacillus xylaniclasticus TaxID=588083 RepID=UPI000FD90238|nr:MULTISPECIES: response regulator transcription factor [Paenibacillus]GFN32736.1 nitrate/nitrite response regulator protein [Paenibacillus curdlanolyticus]